MYQEQKFTQSELVLNVRLKIINKNLKTEKTFYDIKYI